MHSIDFDLQDNDIAHLESFNDGFIRNNKMNDSAKNYKRKDLYNSIQRYQTLADLGYIRRSMDFEAQHVV